MGFCLVVWFKSLFEKLEKILSKRLKRKEKEKQNPNSYPSLSQTNVGPFLFFFSPFFFSCRGPLSFWPNSYHRPTFLLPLTCRLTGGAHLSCPSSTSRCRPSSSACSFGWWLMAGAGLF
jgi:hypothetical protein